MRRMMTCVIAVALLMAANIGFGQVAASRAPRQQDKAFRWDPVLGAWIREVPRQTGLDRHDALGDASPVDITNNASAPQYTRSLFEDQTNSRLDDYINQDEQINLQPDSGLVKVLRTNQKRVINDFVTALVPLKNVPPREMRGIFRAVCGKEGGFADVLQDFETKENFLQVVCPEFMLPSVVQSLKALDEKWVKENEDGRAHAYYKPKFRDAGPLLNIMQFFRGPMETFFWDTVGNAIQFTGQPAVIFGLFPYGTKMCDIPPSQIKLDVAIYEVDVKNDLKLGLDWVAWKNGPGSDLFQTVVADGPSWIGHFRWVNLHAVATAAYVDFLASKGKARLVTRTAIVTKSGSMGEVAAVDQVLAFDIRHNADNSRYFNLNDYTTPPLATYAPTPPAPYLRPVGTPSAFEPAVLTAVVTPEDALIPQFHDRVLNYVQSGTVGVFLGVRPWVGLETAEVAISLHVTDFDGYTPQGQPLIGHRFTESYVRVKDGTPFVLAGLKRQATVKSRNGIPGLSKIPVVGWLTGGETNSRREVELVVVVTPTLDVSADSKVAAVESKIRLSTDEQAAKDYVLSQRTMPLPKNYLGFDQWLLDGLDQ